MKGKRSRARERAVQALYQWQVTGEDPQEIDVQFLAEQEMGGVDVAYFRELLRQVPHHVEELDAEYAPSLDRPPEQLDPVERAILRLGVYELKYCLQMPYRVVITEAVELAKTFGAEDGHKYVNSILDRVARRIRAVELGNASS